jgi:UDP-N-acetylmuramyl pentapeptide phosphotransferase/UDP-N-acetylglucosamine-1-phosphate transferase
MFANPIVTLLMRDLQICAVITIAAMAVMAVFAVPITIAAEYPDDVRSMPRKMSWVWLVGTVTTAGSWILLTAVLGILLTWVPSLRDLPSTAFFLAYFICVIVSIRRMWLSATASPSSKPRQFSLKTLLIAQLVIVVLCGVWIGVRRSEIDSLYQLQREQTRQAIP